MFELRGYQVEAINKIIDSYNNKELGGVAYLATGLGKTVIASEVIKQINKKTLVLVHKNELVIQFLQKLLFINPDTTYGIVKAGRNELGQQVTIASIQTLLNEKRLNELIDHGPYDLIISDEYHHYNDNQWGSILNQLNGYKLGLTATPNNIKDENTEFLFRYNIFDGIKNKYLCDIKGKKVILDLNLDKVKTFQGDFQEKGLGKMMSTPEIIEATYNAWENNCQDRRTVVFCVNVEHVKALHEYFIAKNVQCEYVLGETELFKRDDIYNQFESGQLKVLFSINVLSEGWDSPSVDAIIIARPTLSETLYIQQIGRGLRLYPKKENCLIIDLVGNSDKHRMIQLGLIFGQVPKNEKDIEDKYKKLGINLPKEQGDIDSVLSLIAKEQDIELENVKERKFEWVKIDNRFVLTMGNDKLGFLVIDKLENNLNSWCITRYYSDGWRDKQDILVKDLPFDWCISLAEKEVERFLGKTHIPLLNTGYEWRHSEPTTKQLEVLKSYKCLKIPKTKGEATSLIVEFMIKSKLDGYNKAILDPKTVKVLTEILEMHKNKQLEIDLGEFKADNLSINEVNKIKALHQFNIERKLKHENERKLKNKVQIRS